MRPQKLSNEVGVRVVMGMVDMLHPGRLTWNLQITHLEKKMIFQPSMIMFHGNLQGCTSPDPTPTHYGNLATSFPKTTYWVEDA